MLKVNLCYPSQVRKLLKNKVNDVCYLKGFWILRGSFRLRLRTNMYSKKRFALLTVHYGVLFFHADLQYICKFY